MRWFCAGLAFAAFVAIAHQSVGEKPCSSPPPLTRIGSSTIKVPTHAIGRVNMHNWTLRIHIDVDFS